MSIFVLLKKEMKSLCVPNANISAARFVRKILMKGSRVKSTKRGKRKTLRRINCLINFWKMKDCLGVLNVKLWFRGFLDASIWFVPPPNAEAKHFFVTIAE